VDACRWASRSIPHAPYVTSLDWISHYGCYYVVHGDDITSDSNGDDCYRFVKAAGRFLVVKRTPGISTTDLVGRMLLCTKGHFIKSFTALLAGNEGLGSTEQREESAKEAISRIRDYATDESGLRPGADVWAWIPSPSSATVSPDDHQPGRFEQLVQGKGLRPGQRIVYVDGGFDLFSSGHIEFLRRVHDLEYQEGVSRGWYLPDRVAARIREHGDDYAPAYVIAGVHDDEVINYWKGLNYPIMNQFERGLCVLQCRVSFTPSPDRLHHGLLMSRTVYPRCRLLRAVYPYRSILERSSNRDTGFSLPRTHYLYASQA
jgi:ethanolamine-phosphate cytidylyltransferase